jgi:hypothetical protein
MERSPEQPESYVLRGGQAGAARLRLINRVKWPTTERLLATAGLRAGMRVLDPLPDLLVPHPGACPGGGPFHDRRSYSGRDRLPASGALLTLDGLAGLAAVAMVMPDQTLWNEKP